MPIISKSRAESLTRKYAGQLFVFNSPFSEDGTTPWETGDEGVIVRLLHHTDKGHPVDAECTDLWEAVRLKNGVVGQVWGGECFEPDSGLSLIVEHRFSDGTRMRDGSEINESVEY